MPLVDKQKEWDEDTSMIYDLNKLMLKEILDSYSNVVSNNFEIETF